MKTKKMRNIKANRNINSNLKFVPDWKYRLLIAHAEKQDKIILQLCKDMDEMTYKFHRLAKVVSHQCGILIKNKELNNEHA